MSILAEGGVLDVNIWTIVWTWVIFGVTLWALSKIAWPMLAAKMEEREIRIREGLEKAEEAEKKAQELLERQESVLDEAREEAIGRKRSGIERVGYLGSYRAHRHNHHGHESRPQGTSSHSILSCNLR